MRFIFLFLLLPFVVNAQAPDPGVGGDGVCDEVDLLSGDPTRYDNCDSMVIGPGSHVIPASPSELRIRVLTTVHIDAGATLVLSGGDGVADDGIGPAEPGGVPGPGGGEGGSDTGLGPSAGPGGSGGLAGDTDPGGVATCGGGGGGGGMKTAGENGFPCAPQAGGTGGPNYIFGAFRGGFGGGAGGSPENLIGYETGTGGGGGGAIWISAGGNINIDGDIDVTGGDGGNGISNSGAGGGGSGGAIRIESIGQVVNNGTFLLSGGQGGTGSAPGGDGGDGAEGVFEMSDADNIIQGVGTGAVGLPGGSSESFNSSISCGAVKMNDEKNLFFQVMLGFALVVLISRIRGQFRRSV